MVGRTPEYLGKKIEAKEVKIAMLAILILPLSILGFMARRDRDRRLAYRACRTLAPRLQRDHLSSIRRASGITVRHSPASPAIRSGTTRPAVLHAVGRYLVIIPMMAVAGSLVAKSAVPPSAGTFPTHGPLFVGLLIGVILILGGLTFFPALALGPIAEHFAMIARTLY